MRLQNKFDPIGPNGVESQSFTADSKLFWRRSCNIARKTSEGTSSFTQSLPAPPLDGASVELVPRTARVYRESLRCQQCEHKRLLISDKRRISRARFENEFLLFSIPGSFYCI